MTELSIVIPVKNEEKNIPVLADAIRRSLGNLNYEVIWVNDGSTDNSSRAVIEGADEKTILVELSRNFGQSVAMKSGIRQSSGRYIAFLDGDGQNDPSDIPPMIEILKLGDWDMVAGNRKNRKDGLFLRKIPSEAANFLIRTLTGVRTRDFGCTLKIIKREFAVNLALKDGLHRFIPVLVHRLGGRITQVDVKHHPREHGKSKYGLERIFFVTRDLFNLLLVKDSKQITHPEARISYKF